MFTVEFATSHVSLLLDLINVCVGVLCFLVFTFMSMRFAVLLSVVLVA